jgi:hypothetical protein
MSPATKATRNYTSLYVYLPARPRQKLICTVLPHPSEAVTVPEGQDRVVVDGAVLCFWQSQRCECCRQIKPCAIAHENCYRLLDKDSSLVMSHLSPIYPTSRSRRESQANMYLRKAWEDTHIRIQLSTMDLSVLPPELQEWIWDYAWPCAYLNTVVFQWARNETLSAAKKITQRNHFWDPRIPHIIQYTSIMGIQYVANIAPVETKVRNVSSLSTATNSVVIAFDEYGIMSIQCLNDEVTVEDINGALWYKTLRHDNILRLKHKVRPD